MTISYASYSDIGSRENNEDALGIHAQDQTLLAVVADGLGGQDNGELASRLAVDTIIQELTDKELDEEALAYSLIHASDAIRESQTGGQTTAVALWLNDTQGAAAHVGDSRIYQFRDGRIIFQSVDHSLVQMALMVGELSADEVRHHKDRNKLFRVLGEQKEEARTDSAELTVSPGDRFLLCSDGFWEPVTEKDMLRTLQDTETPRQWLDAMRQIVESARNPKQDNYSAICIFVK